MAKNGNPDPVFYTDEDKMLFLVTLPCHAELKGIVTKLGNKSVTKLTREDIDEIFAKTIDLKVLSDILEFDITNVSDYIRDYIRTKSIQKVTKSTQKVIKSAKKVTRLFGLADFLTDEKSRYEILSFLELDNQTKNFATHIKPLIENGIIELTSSDKPNSRFQKYRLTEKGKKLTK